MWANNYKLKISNAKQLENNSEVFVCGKQVLWTTYTKVRELQSKGEIDVG